MLHKIGLLVVIAAGFICTVLAVAIAATPVVLELEKLYKPAPVQQGHADPWEVASEATVIPDSAANDGEVSWCASHPSSKWTFGPISAEGLRNLQKWNPKATAAAMTPLTGSCDASGHVQANSYSDLPVGTTAVSGPSTGHADPWQEYKVNETASLVTVPLSSIEFPAGMSDSEIIGKLLVDENFRSSLKIDLTAQSTASPFWAVSQKAVSPGNANPTNQRRRHKCKPLSALISQPSSRINVKLSSALCKASLSSTPFLPPMSRERVRGGVSSRLKFGADERSMRFSRPSGELNGTSRTWR